MDEIFKRVECFHSQFLEELKTAYSNCQHVTNISAWFERFDQLTKGLEKGNSTYRQIEDHIFELKIVNHLLKSFSGCVISYEPTGLNPEGKNCDLEIQFESARYLLEVKCFHPKWEKAKIPTQHIAEDNAVIMGGECYHNYQATRGHLLDVTLDTEEKLKNYARPFTSVLAVPDGFHLSIEDLRDFVFIYRHGRPRPDDPLGPMTMHNLDRSFNGTIDQFWTFPFPQESFSLESNSHVIAVAPFMHHDIKVRL